MFLSINNVLTNIINSNFKFEIYTINAKIKYILNICINLDNRKQIRKIKFVYKVYNFFKNKYKKNLQQLKDNILLTTLFTRNSQTKVLTKYKQNFLN